MHVKSVGKPPPTQDVALSYRLFPARTRRPACTLGNGVDVELFAPRPIDRGRFWRRALVEEPQGAIPGRAPGSASCDEAAVERIAGGPILLYVGRFTAVKRLDRLIGAFALAQERTVTPAALVLVGVFMVRPVVKINWLQLDDAIPAFLAMVLIPFTYSITQGIIWGFLSWTVIKLIVGKREEVSIALVVIDIFAIVALVLE